MKCVEFETSGTPADVLNCVERERPVPMRGQVLVRMLASPVNPSDLMFIRGNYGRAPRLPQVPGFEGVGVVESSGGGIRGKFFTGKRVAVLNRNGGNWAQYVALPASQVIPLSPSLSLQQAATFFVNPATAWIMTQEVLRVPANAWLLQTAAASSLGRMVIRLGRELGFRTLNVVRNADPLADLKALGADRVIVFNPDIHSEEHFHSELRAAIGTDSLKFAIDPVGGMTGSAVLRSLSQGGRMLVYGTLSDAPLQFSPRTLMTADVSVEGFWLGNYMARQNLLFKLRLVRRITRLIKNGVLSTEIAHQFSLDNIRDAILASQGPSIGKTLLMTGE